MNKRYHKCTHKIGIQVPKTWGEAVRLDEGNGNTLWQDSIRKEMNNVRIAFKVLNGEEAIPPTYQEIRCHMIFDVNMEDFLSKARFVAGGHTTDAPHVMTYANVVSKDFMRIALTLAALNDVDVDVMMGDIENAYLTVPITEKVWTVLGPEFGEDTGKRALIVRALYGLKSAGAAFRNHLVSCMDHLGWKPCLYDRFLWMKEETRPDEGVKYCAYILIYVDAILCVHHDPGSAQFHTPAQNPNLVLEVVCHFGAQYRALVNPSPVGRLKGIRCLLLQLPVPILLQELLHILNRCLDVLARAHDPSHHTIWHHSLLEPSSQVEGWFHNGAWSHLEILINLRITGVSMLSTFFRMPHEGHLDAVYHVFAYLLLHHNARVVFAPSYPDIDMRAFIKTDWKPMYGGVKEAIPPMAPVARGKAIELHLFVDSDHAGEHFTYRSRTGFVIYLNIAPIVWFSKRQPYVDSNVFGDEFVAMNNGIDTTRGLCYKLRMMGVTIDGPIYVYGDNMSVVHNTQRPEYVMKKTRNIICYHTVRGNGVINHWSCTFCEKPS
jgi:hypothetical protein